MHLLATIPTITKEVLGSLRTMQWGQWKMQLFFLGGIHVQKWDENFLAFSINNHKVLDLNSHLFGSKSPPVFV